MEKKYHTNGNVLSYTIDPTTKQTIVTVKVPEPSQDPFSNISYTGCKLSCRKSS